MIGASAMPLPAGTGIGPHEIVAPLRQGGMGEVYRATDKHLGRAAAIEVLPETFALDIERIARFEREARTLASLNHPNIAQVFGLEKGEGGLALAMELVEGPTLAERLERGPIPVDEAIAVGRQVAEALEAAHDQGIVHRDLKPANIKVRDDGLIMGTAAYMSPEQARGRPVDRRADVWACGCVLYEMLWNADGAIIFSSSATAGVWTVPATGGTGMPVTVLDKARGETAHLFPQFLPDTRRFVHLASGPNPAVFVGSLEGGPSLKLCDSSSAVIVASPNALLSVQGDALVAQHFDFATLKPIGDPRPVADGILRTPASERCSSRHRK